MCDGDDGKKQQERQKQSKVMTAYMFVYTIYIVLISLSSPSLQQKGGRPGVVVSPSKQKIGEGVGSDPLIFSSAKRKQHHFAFHNAIFIYLSACVFYI